MSHWGGVATHVGLIDGTFQSARKLCMVWEANTHARHPSLRDFGGLGERWKIDAERYEEFG